MGRLSQSIRAIPRTIIDKRSVILRRLLIYGLILLMMAPVIFINRTQIYSALLSRHDDYVESFNHEGLPVTDYGYQANAYVGPQTTPRATANAAIEYYEMILEGNTTSETYFNNTIQWLIDHKTNILVPTENGSMEIIHWYFDFSIWDLPKGWYQAMTDAKAINALALAYKRYGNESYVEIAEKAAESFRVPTRLGGNLLILEDGTSWYPEYIVPNELDSDYEFDMILNGFLICLLHLYRANQILNMTLIDDIFNLGAISAAANLYKYDMDINWTRYHLAYPQKVAPRNYHEIHIYCTRQLYEYTNVTIFKTYADRWTSYTNYPSFTIAELTSPEFIYYGLVVTALILLPVVTIDVIQATVRRWRSGTSEKEDVQE